ncbi:MAG: hypothetical protein ACK41W_09920 [Cyanobacteriota bacterium]
MTTSPSPGAPSTSSGNGASPSSLPRWRSFLSTLNWRRDPDYEQRKMRSELRMRQIEERTKRIENETVRIEIETERIKKETERLRLENARLRQLNAKSRHLISCVDQLCFPPESSSTPAPSTETDSRPSSP